MAKDIIKSFYGDARLNMYEKVNKFIAENNIEVLDFNVNTPCYGANFIALRYRPSSTAPVQKITTLKWAHDAMLRKVVNDFLADNKGKVRLIGTPTTSPTPDPNYNLVIVAYEEIPQ